jgi:hypothetical protein
LNYFRKFQIYNNSSCIGSTHLFCKNNLINDNLYDYRLCIENASKVLNGFGEYELCRSCKFEVIQLQLLVQQHEKDKKDKKRKHLYKNLTTDYKNRNENDEINLK